MSRRRLLQLAAENDVLPGLGAVDERVTERQSVVMGRREGAHVGHDPGAGTDVDEVVRAGLDIRRRLLAWIHRSGLGCDGGLDTENAS